VLTLCWLSLSDWVETPRKRHFSMLDNEDLKWIATKATELNAMLQQISRYSDLARQHKGEYKYIEILGERVGLASRTGQSIFDHVTSKIFAGTMGRINDSSKPLPEPRFSVFKPPAFPANSSEPKSEPSSGGEASTSLDLEAKEQVNRQSTSVGELPDGMSIKNPTGNHELILIVEDEAEVAEFAAEMLIEEGYKVIVAKDGFQALDVYRRIGKAVGLVILDFFLPVIDGDAVFDELRALNPAINVVLSSGFTEQSKLGSMLAQGLRGFIPKPYTRQKLLDQVHSTLA
jgi:CheY-like chemotaxis protein